MATHFQPRTSATVIDAVLQHADIREDLGGGRVLHRLSPKRARTRWLRAELGRVAARAAEVAVIYDEREGQIFRVVDTGPLTPAYRFDENDDRWWSGRQAHAA